MLYRELYKVSVLLDVSVRGGYAVRSYVGERVGTILTLYFLKSAYAPVAEGMPLFSNLCCYGVPCIFSRVRIVTSNCN